MIWLTLRQFLSRAWLWVKQNWEITLGLIFSVIVVSYFSKGRKIDIRKILTTLREKQQKEAAAIIQSQASERDAIEKVRKKTESAIIAIEKKYKDSSESLDKKKKKEIRKIIEENKEDSETITRRLAELTGFTIIVRDDV